MANAHFFVVDDLAAFITNLEAREYRRDQEHEEGREYLVYSRTMSNALTKYYSIPSERDPFAPVQIRVTYRLIKEAQNLAKLARELKSMNEKYRKALPIWKTKRAPRTDVRDKRWDEIQKWLRDQGELIDCFKYQGDDRLTEGNHSYNLMVASTPKEQRVCFDFIRALSEAFAPGGIVRGRREADKPRQQRNGWIKRYADMHKKRGWSPLEIAREIQKELREGTWDERSRLQYNLANNTILKIAGLKLPVHQQHHASSYN